MRATRTPNTRSNQIFFVLIQVKEEEEYIAASYFMHKTNRVLTVLSVIEGDLSIWIKRIEGKKCVFFPFETSATLNKFITHNPQYCRQRSFSDWAFSVISILIIIKTVRYTAFFYPQHTRSMINLAICMWWFSLLVFRDKSTKHMTRKIVFFIWREGNRVYASTGEIRLHQCCIK